MLTEMVCPKCGHNDMSPDHDVMNRIEVWRCPKCGKRVYPGYPVQPMTEEEKERQRLLNDDLRIGDIVYCKSCLEKGKKVKIGIVHRHTSVSAKNSPQFCSACKKERQNQRNKENSLWKKQVRKSQPHYQSSTQK